MVEWCRWSKGRRSRTSTSWSLLIARQTYSHCCFTHSYTPRCSNSGQTQCFSFISSFISSYHRSFHISVRNLWRRCQKVYHFDDSKFQTSYLSFFSTSQILLLFFSPHNKHTNEKSTFSLTKCTILHLRGRCKMKKKEKNETITFFVDTPPFPPSTSIILNC